MTNKNPNESPVSRKSVEFDADQVIKAVVNTAKAHGAESLILGISSGGLITTHMQNVSVATGINTAITLINQLCDIEATGAQKENNTKRVLRVEKMRGSITEAIKTFNKEL